MNREIWEFKSEGSHLVIQAWLKDEKISPRDRAKLDRRIDNLRTMDFELLSHKLLAGPLMGTKVYKLRIFGENRQLRPRLCRGPVGAPEDFTFLLGALEVGDRPVPSDADDAASHNRNLLIKNPNWREILT